MSDSYFPKYPTQGSPPRLRMIGTSSDGKTSTDQVNQTKQALHKIVEDTQAKVNADPTDEKAQKVLELAKNLETSFKNAEADGTITQDEREGLNGELTTLNGVLGSNSRPEGYSASGLAPWTTPGTWWNDQY